MNHTLPATGKQRASVSTSVSSVPWQRRTMEVLLYTYLVVGALLVLLPYLWMISAAFKAPGEIFKAEINFLPKELYLGNFETLFRNYPILRWLWNSLVISTIVVVSNLVWATSAGYAFARLRFPGRDVLFYIYLGAMMVPLQVRLIPSFILIRELGMLNTYQGIASLQLIEFFGVFLMRQFMLNIPSELEDAARIDGCGYPRVLWQIVVPNVKPALIALGLLTFTASWNNFLWPLVIISQPAMMTIQVGLAAMKGESIAWGVLMAGTAISAAPLAILYIVLQRLFTQGVVLSGIKG